MIRERKAAGITQAAVAACMGVSRTFVSNFELGDVEVTDTLLERYAAALAQAKKRHTLRATS